MLMEWNEEEIAEFLAEIEGLTGVDLCNVSTKQVPVIG